MDKKEYVSLKIETICFDNEDVITNSYDPQENVDGAVQDTRDMGRVVY